jgi:hypothetical protein
MSAYSSQISNRNMYSAHVSPSEIRPLVVADSFSAPNATAVLSDLPASRKVEFIVKLYLLQNWGSERIATATEDKVALAKSVLEIKDHLIADGLLNENVPVPCTITFVNVTTTVGARTGVTNQAEEVD